MRTREAIDIPELETVRILDGQFVFTMVKDDIAMSPHIREEKHWEPWNTHAWRNMISEGNIVVDAGANWGYFTLIASAAVGKKGTVLAFEPNLISRHILMLNLNQNNIRNVAVFCYGLGDKTEEAIMSYTPTNLGGASLDIGAAKCYECSQIVPVYRFDEIHLGSVNAVKIDTEGMDGKVLAGMGHTIDRNRNIKIICEFIPDFHPDHGVAMLDTIDSLGLSRRYVSPSGEIIDRTREWLLNEPGSTLYLEHK